MSVKNATLYKYVSTKYVADILDNHMLYLNDGTGFNDPFEVAVTDKATHQIRHIEGLHILSLTTSYRKKLMWSHYAESHKGVCLTVKVPKHLVYPICYSTKRVFEDSDIDGIISSSVKKASCVKKNVNNNFFQLSKDKKVAYIKDKKWQHEKEYRLVFDKSDENGLVCRDGKWYMSVKISNIYLGVNFENNDKEKQNEIIEACNRNKISMSRMVLSEANYAINVER